MANYKCPHCEAINEVQTQSWDQKFEENLPGGLLRAVTATALAAANPLFGVIAASTFAAEAIYKYSNGTAVTCGKCGEDFRI